eukprot:gene7799-12273_t
MRLVLAVLCVIVLAINANNVVVEQAIAKSDIKSVEEYWTPERLADVAPMELPLNPDVTETSTKLTKIEANTKPVPTPYKKAPHIYTGKLLFQTPKGRSSCTASAVGGNVVLTAGHCLHGDGAFYKNVVFIPQFLNGKAPKGQWVGVNLRIHRGWVRRQFHRDVGALTVSSQGGKTLEQALGGKLTPVYNSNAYNSVEVLGYPGNFGNAQKMIHSKGKQEFGRRATPTIKKSPSQMTFGASGGPWTISNGKNVDSVNSFITSNPSRWIYGPSFDSEVRQVVGN